MFAILGFAAQVCLLLSIAAIVISCVSSPRSVVATDITVADATLPVSAYSAKSMTSPLYTTVVDKLESSSDDLGCLTIRQLKSLCRERGIKRYSSLRKSDLVELLSAL